MSTLTGKRRVRVWRAWFRPLRVVVQVEVRTRRYERKTGEWVTRVGWRDARPEDLIK